MDYRGKPPQSKLETPFNDEVWGSNQTPPDNTQNQFQAPQTGAPHYNTIVNHPNSPNNNAANLAMSFIDPAITVTTEDLLFLRQRRREARARGKTIHKYTAIPTTGIALASLYIYNRMNNKPHGWVPYTIVGSIAWVVAKLTYLPTMRQKVAESNLDTPVMRALKRGYSINTNPVQNFNSASYNYSPNETEFKDDPWKDSEYSKQTVSPDKSRDDIGFHDPYNSSDQSQTKPAVSSYDELRMKNRGYIR